MAYRYVTSSIGGWFKVNTGVTRQTRGNTSEELSNSILSISQLMCCCILPTPCRFGFCLGTLQGSVIAWGSDEDGGDAAEELSAEKNDLEPAPQPPPRRSSQNIQPKCFGFVAKSSCLQSVPTPLALLESV
eukprot:6378080-Amphidinium_carterae.1